LGASGCQCRHSHEGFGTHFGADAQERYLDLQREDIAKAFGLLQDGNTDKDEGEAESRVADFTSGEGRCPVVPLVFKTRNEQESEDSEKTDK